nr:MAG TPA: hypothetical protein [Caudoviricetes sp.]
MTRNCHLIKHDWVVAACDRLSIKIIWSVKYST